MSKSDIINHNETLAVHKIREACKTQGLTEAMELCKTFTGITELRALHNKTCGMCFDLLSGDT